MAYEDELLRRYKLKVNPKNVYNGNLFYVYGKMVFVVGSHIHI